jgi:hypothetical protein
MFFPTLAWPSAQARRAKFRNIGYGLRNDFELNFGRYLPTFGPAENDSTDTQREGGPSGYKRFRPTRPVPHFNLPCFGPSDVVPCWPRLAGWPTLALVGLEPMQKGVEWRR